MAAKMSAPHSTRSEQLAFNSPADARPLLADPTPVDDATVLPQSGYLTADWVKRRYSISNSTLYKWIAEDRFPRPRRIGPRAVRFSAESLREFEATLVEDGH